MRKLLEEARIFFSTLRDCVSSTWRQMDSHYHLPRSRFRGSFKESARDLPQPEAAAGKRLRVFYRSLTHCVSTAWAEADRHYHIPKSRFGNVLREGKGFQPAPFAGAVPNQVSFFGLGTEGIDYHDGGREGDPRGKGAPTGDMFLSEPEIGPSRAPTVTRD